MRSRLIKIDGKDYNQAHYSIDKKNYCSSELPTIANVFISATLYCLIYVKITFGIPFADFTPEPRHCCEGFTMCNGGLGTWYLLGITLVLCVVVVVAYQQSSVRTSELLELNELV